MMSMTFLSFFLLALIFFSLPVHSSPAPLGMAILTIVILLLVFFVSLNMTLSAIFITLVYISGILILFSYFFSLIQNTKFFLIPVLVVLSVLALSLMFFFYVNFNEIFSSMFSISNSSNQESFLWVLSDSKLIFFFILILLVSMLFIEKAIGLKQKPLRVK